MLLTSFRSLLTLTIPLMISTQVYADNANWLKHSLVFDLEIDMNKVYEVTHSQPSEIVNYIKQSGRDILLVNDENSSNTKNPIFKDVPYASADLIKKAQYQKSYAGRMIPASSPCCDFKVDTILIRDTAPTYILIHEYLHSLLEFKGQVPADNIESLFASEERKQLFYQRKLFENPMGLLSTLWRRDILSSQQQIVDMLYDRIRIGQAQEAIIEKILSRYIDSKSPYYNAEKAKEALGYGEANINNAITVYNNLHFSINWNINTVKDLRLGLESKDIKTVEKNESLTKEEAEAFVLNSQKQLDELKKTEKEILKMKSFYTK